MSVNIHRTILSGSEQPNATIVARFKDGSQITADCIWEDSGFFKHGDILFNYLFRGVDPDNADNVELHNQIKECMCNKPLDGKIKVVRHDNPKLWRNIAVEMMLQEVYSPPPPNALVTLFKRKIKI